MSNTFAQRMSNRKVLVDVLAVMFGLGTWIGVNGIYVQLPLLVKPAPEGWKLATHIVMVVQIANLGPILYTLYTKYSSWIRDHFIIYGLLGTATMSIYLMAFFYDTKSWIFGSEHSTALLVLMFLTAFVGCTSSVLFTPYMRNYREIYLISYLVGEGLSGFIPSSIALIQGVGGNAKCNNITKPGDTKISFAPEYPEPRFSLEVFFMLLGTLLLMSFISFIGLRTFRIAKGERVKPPASTETLSTEMSAPKSYKTNPEFSLPRRTYFYYLMMIGLICFLGHSTLPGIQTYSCLPYGNVAYHLTVTIASMATPLSMCLGFVQKSPPTLGFLSALTGLLVFLSGIIIHLALKSPAPPFQDSWFGTLLIVTLWVLVNGLIGFIKMEVTTIFRPDPNRGLYFIGVASQVGSLIGALTTFYAVNYRSLFVEYMPCDAFSNL